MPLRWHSFARVKSKLPVFWQLITRMNLLSKLTVKVSIFTCSKQVSHVNYLFVFVSNSEVWKKVALVNLVKMSYLCEKHVTCMKSSTNENLVSCLKSKSFTLLNLLKVSYSYGGRIQSKLLVKRVNKKTCYGGCLGMLSAQTAEEGRFR